MIVEDITSLRSGLLVYSMTEDIQFQGFMFTQLVQRH